MKCNVGKKLEMAFVDAKNVSPLQYNCNVFNFSEEAVFFSFIRQFKQVAFLIIFFYFY